VIDPLLAVVAFGIGIIVGLTGMGGGALMTPVMVFFFNVTPLAAVSSDLVAAAVMKPVGSFVHLRRGTVNLQLVRWLAVGSVPGVERLLGVPAETVDYFASPTTYSTANTAADLDGTGV